MRTGLNANHKRLNMKYSRPRFLHICESSTGLCERNECSRKRIRSKAKSGFQKKLFGGTCRSVAVFLRLHKVIWEIFEEALLSWGTCISGGKNVEMSFILA